ncbi:MAG: DUF2071 domain-containing protein [Acidobacteriota bacterium]
MHIQIKMRDMLFINYAVPPSRLRPLVPEQFELDLQIDNQSAFISAVAFRNEDIKAGVLPLPEYDQINYRAYILHGEERAVYFFDMNVNSRVIATGTNFLGLPVGYEEIEIVARADEEMAGELRLSVTSAGPHGLAAEVAVRERGSSQLADLSTEFFTERPAGYVKAPAGGLLKVMVEHERIAARLATVESARALFFESLGLIDEEESRNPHSILYVSEALFNTSPPALMLF